MVCFMFGVVVWSRLVEGLVRKRWFKAMRQLLYCVTYIKRIFFGLLGCRKLSAVFWRFVCFWRRLDFRRLCWERV